jgi:hypothetical protein
MKDKMFQLASEYDDKPTTAISLEMPVELFKKVKESAAMEKTDYQVVINCLVHQGLGDSQAEVKRLLFEKHVKKVLKKHDVHPNAFDEIFNRLEFY